MTFTTELTVPPRREFSSLVEGLVSDAAQRSDLTLEQQRGIVDAACRGFGTVIEEAIVETREPIRIAAVCTPLHLNVSIFERGLPMDDSVAQRNPNWNELTSSVDSVRWRSRGTAGSELRLTVKRNHCIEHDNAVPPFQEDVPLAPEQEYTIRRFQPADACGVARAFYLTYGYAYDLSAVYVPRQLIELNQSGRYVSIVAVTKDGDVVGHYALSRDDDGPIADGCGAIVLPAHRGRNLLNRLREVAEGEAIAMGLAAYYSEPVTDHPRTQRASETFGAKACGIVLGEVPRSFVARHLELSTTKQRQSCMLYVKPLRPREQRMIYPPPHHRAIIESIYAGLNLPVEIGESGQPRDRSIFHTEVNARDGTATILIEAIGEDTAHRARQAIEDLLKLRRLGAIYTSLPLEHPGTPVLCETMESCGFFFSGLGPWMLNGKDALRLQMTLTPIDLSVLVVVGSFGRVLLDYVDSERKRCSTLEPRS